MNASSEPESIVELTREYGAYGWERSGLGLVLGDFLLGLQVGVTLGGQLGWAVAQAVKSSDPRGWPALLREGMAMGHPAIVAIILVPPLLWLVGKELIRRRYQALGRVRLTEMPSLRMRRIVACVLMAFVSLCFLCLMPMAVREGWNSGTALLVAGLFALLFPLASWRVVAPSAEALIALVFHVFVLSALMGAKGTFLLGMGVMVAPAAFLGGLEGMCQHLEFRTIKKRLTEGRESEA